MTEGINTNNSNDADTIHKLALAKDVLKEVSPLLAFWTMVEAQAEITEEPILDTAVVLHFMGCGASTMVTAGDFRKLTVAADALQASL